MMRITESQREEISRNRSKSADRKWALEHNDEISIAKQIQKQSGCSWSEALREAAEIIRRRPLFP